jgi:hypothetical protein
MLLWERLTPRIYAREKFCSHILLLPTGVTLTCRASEGMWVVWLDGRHLIVLTMFRVLYAGVYIVRRANYAYTGLTLSRLFLLASPILPLTLARVMSA